MISRVRSILMRAPLKTSERGGKIARACGLVGGLTRAAEDISSSDRSKSMLLHALNRPIIGPFSLRRSTSLSLHFPLATHRRLQPIRALPASSPDEDKEGPSLSRSPPLIPPITRSLRIPRMAKTASMNKNHGPQVRVEPSYRIDVAWRLILVLFSAQTNSDSLLDSRKEASGAI